MSTTFANFSKSSTTNYLFLFAQRTLALQNTSPTPPPLNALGLPCEAMCLLWDWLHPPEKVHPKKVPTKKKALDKKRSAISSEKAEFRFQPTHGKPTNIALHATPGEQRPTPSYVRTEKATRRRASVQLKAAALANAAADKSQTEVTNGSPTSVCDSEELPRPPPLPPPPRPQSPLSLRPSRPAPRWPAIAAAAAAAEGGKAMGKKKKIAEKIAPLAEKITEYILDHQDDATQEDRWRTTRRDMAKGFREQREASEKSFSEQREANEKQREAIARLESRFDMQPQLSAVKNVKNLTPLFLPTLPLAQARKNLNAEQEPQEPHRPPARQLSIDATLNSKIGLRQLTKLDELDES